MKTRKYKIQVNPYNCELYLVLTQDVYKAAKRIAKEVGDDVGEDDGETVGFFLSGTIPGSPYYLILIFNPSLGDVVHEVQHATFEVLRGHGVKLSLDSEEAFTYLMDYLFAEVLKRINK